MYLNIPQESAHKVNGYVVVPYADTREVLYECERRYWGKEVHEQYKNFTWAGIINCSFIPQEILNDNNTKDERIAYFAILEDF